MQKSLREKSKEKKEFKSKTKDCPTQGEKADFVTPEALERLLRDFRDSRETPERLPELPTDS